jgi:quercetin dioxygenase-like cupin family protein
MAGAVLPVLALADAGLAPLPTPVLDTEVAGMPSAPLQEIRVLTAEVGPGQVTVHHTHRFPVTTYVLDGAMTFTLAGQDPVTVAAGQAFIEPPDTGVTGENPSASAPAHVVMFYVSDPATPFLDVVN